MVDTDIDAEDSLSGKYVSDLQSNVVISNEGISGTLNYLDDYTGYSETAALQVGNFLAIHTEVPDVEDVTIVVRVTDDVTPDSNGYSVLRITDKNSQTVTVVASKSGYQDVKRVYSLTDLVLLAAEAGD